MTADRVAFAKSPRFSVAFEGVEGPELLAHRVSLAEALGLVLSQVAPDATPREIGSVSALAGPGVFVFHSTKLGAYRKRKGVQGLEHAPFRRRVLLAWGCAPPLHDSVYGILLDHEASGTPECGTMAPWLLGDRFLEEVLALVPPENRAVAIATGVAVERRAIPTAQLLALRAVRGVLLARDLAVATAAEAQGALRVGYRGLVFDGGHTLDALLGVLDEKGIRWSRARGTSPVFEVEGAVDGHSFRMRIVESAEVGGLAATVFARELSAVLPRLTSRLGFSTIATGKPENENREGWLRASLASEVAPESLLAEGLAAPSLDVRSHAFEAAWLAMTPSTLGILRARAALEPDEGLRLLIATTVALLAPAAPDEPTTRGALRKASDLRKARRLEGLEELAATEPPADLRTPMRDLLGDVQTNAADRDARFVAGLLAWLASDRR
jgi:hypothetical protein